MYKINAMYAYNQHYLSQDCLLCCKISSSSCNYGLIPCYILLLLIYLSVLLHLPLFLVAQEAPGLPQREIKKHMNPVTKTFFFKCLKIKKQTQTVSPFSPLGPTGPEVPCDKNQKLITQEFKKSIAPQYRSKYQCLTSRPGSPGSPVSPFSPGRPG